MIIFTDKKTKRLLSVCGKIIFLTSLLSSIYTAFYSSHSGYELLFLLPFSYTIFVFLSRLLFKHSYSVFYLFFTLISFLRYIILPFFIVYSGYYGGTSIVPPQPSSYRIAIILMCYELIISIILVYILEKRIKKKHSINRGGIDHNLSLSQSNGTTNGILSKKYPIYYIAIILLLLFFIFNRSWQSITHNVLSDSFVTDAIGGSDFDTGSNMLSGMLFQLLKSFLFIIISFKVIQKLNKKKGFNLWSAIGLMIIIALNTALIFGLNRMKLVMTFFTSIIFLWNYSIQKGKLIIFIIPAFFIGGFVLDRVTEARQYYTFTDNKTVSNTHTLQVYLGGPYNVAIAVEMANNQDIPSGIANLVFDFLRPMLGVNSLVKDWDMEYSNEHFNKRYHLSDHMSQIIPMIGQGNHYFGPIFAPILGCFFIWLSYFIMNWSLNNNNPFRYYFSLMVVLRMTYFMGQNSMNLINFISFTLFPYLILEFLNNFIARRR